jgi:hypothetical protein
MPIRNITILPAFGICGLKKNLAVTENGESLSEGILIRLP